MSEAAGGGRAEMERRIIERSLKDESYRQRLRADPKGTLEEELGTRLPEGIQVRAVEESAQSIYLVLPSATPVDELSDEALEAVAGGVEIHSPDNVCGDASNEIGELNPSFGNTTANT